MHPYVLLLLLCGWGASAHFLPLKEIPLLQNKTKSAIIDEMLCLLKNEKPHLNNSFTTPTCTKCANCACNNTEVFIDQLKSLKSPCMKILISDMRKLSNHCLIMKRKSANEDSCAKMKADFYKFRCKLEEFLKWLSQTNDCVNIVRDELGLDGSCGGCCSLKDHCRDLL